MCPKVTSGSRMIGDVERGFRRCGGWTEIKHKCWMQIRLVEFESNAHTPVFLLSLCGLWEQKAWRDEDLRSAVLFRSPLSLLGWEQEELGTTVLSLIGLDFGGTQLPADRTFTVRGSAPPAGAAKVMAAHTNQVPDENTRGQITNWFCSMSVTSCLNSNSAHLCATKASSKALSAVT